MVIILPLVIMKNSPQKQRQRTTTIPLLIAYVIFGALHEFAHLLTASWLLQDSTTIHHNEGGNILTLILQILLGRCVNIPLHDKNKLTISIIRHSGWIFSTVIAIIAYALYKRSILKSSIVPIAACITAVEGITTDLLGFIPQHQQQWKGSCDYLTLFCGNFGVLLLNSSWLSIDGGRTALDVLEKMVSYILLYLIVL